MRPIRRPREVRIGQTLHIDYGLTQSTPVFLGSSTYERERALDVDLHEAIEVGIMLTGAQERHWQGFACVAEPGDAWLCGTWEPHGWRVLLPNSQDVIVVFLPGYVGDEVFGDVPWLSLFAAPPSQRPRVGSPEKRELVLALGRELLREYQEELPAWESAVRLNLLKLLFAVSRGWSPPSALSASSHARPSALSHIIPALRLVHLRPIRRVAVAEAAAACGLSRARFCLVFKQSMGLSFGEFCLRARLAHAAARLLDTRLATDVIAEESGFTDASHLHRSFLKRYGCTPAHYRDRAHPLPTAGGLDLSSAGDAA